MKGKGAISPILEMALSFLGLALMVYYDLCDTACSSLRGYFLGLDLKYVGIIFMSIYLIASLPRLPLKIAPFTEYAKQMMISGALGGEVLLVRFQVVNNIYCPFCLAFAGILVLLFILQVRKINPYLALACFFAGIFAFSLFFKGSVLPLYSFL